MGDTASIQRTIRDILEITMPNRAFASCVSFTAGVLLSGTFDLRVALLGAPMILCTYMSQAIVNNLQDIEGDRTNAPERPLACGSIKVRSAWALMLFLIALGFVFAALASPMLIAVNILYIILGVVYSTQTKSRWYLSYATLVTTHIVIPLVSGYLLFQGLGLKIVLIAAFMYLTEIPAFSIKDYKDVQGDREMGMRTLPIVFTPEKAARITFIGFCLPLLLVWVPWYFLGLSTLFLAIYLVAGALRYHFASKLLSSPLPATASLILKNFRYILLLQMIGWCLS
ncbi:MAG: UbiA family prenyltransferase [Candidatus Micrarchaeota archaeon]